jgi:outer membrane receptor protein involved in Fe transport
VSWTKVVTLISFLAAILCSAHAQQTFSVSGVVEDRTGATVADAEVRFQSDHFNALTRTGQDGRFTFSSIPDVSGVLTIVAPGFATVEQAWSSSPAAVPLTVTLQPASANEQVLVSATRTDMKLSDLPGSAVLLSTEDVRANPALTLDDMLRQVPGFTLFRRSSSRVSNPTSQGVSLRGIGASGPSRALVLEDGVPIVDPFGGWVYWDRIPRAELASVEVVRGGASSLYGSDALGGVIEFFTRVPVNSRKGYIDNPPPEYFATVDSSYGTENTPDVSAWTGAAFSRGRYATVGADLARTDGYILIPRSQRGAVDTAANSEHTAIDFSAGLAFSDTGKAFLRGTFFDEARNNGTPLTTNSTGTGFGVAGINTALGAHDSISARLYGQAQGYDQTFSSVATDRSTETLVDVQHVPSQQLGTAMQWNHALGRQTLIAGVDAQEVMGASDEQLFSSSTGNHFADNIAGGRQRSTGIFGQDIFQTGNWTFIAGVRWDRWTNLNGSTVRIPVPSAPAIGTQYPDRDATAFSPRLSILRKFTPNLSLSLSGYRAFRAPTLNELYRSFRLGNTVTQSNALLGPERSTGAEAGLRETALGGRLEARETVFWADVVDPVSNVTISTTPILTTRQRQNLGRTRSIGTELDGSVRLRGYFQISAGYQYAHATVVEASAVQVLVGLNVPEVPRHQASLEARYWNPSKLMLSVQGRYSGVQFDDDRNTLRLGGFYVMEAYAGRQIHRGLTAYVAAENVLNRRYVVTLTGPANSALQNLGPPILARAGLRFEFPSAK